MSFLKCKKIGPKFLESHEILSPFLDKIEKLLMKWTTWEIFSRFVMGTCPYSDNGYNGKCITTGCLKKVYRVNQT